jgi:hypothetical protein
MEKYLEVATAFASALVHGQFDSAYTLLDSRLKEKYTPDKLLKSFKLMYQGYSQGSPSQIHFDEEFSLQEWPGKKLNDVGWVYVSIIGEDFVEAVCVIVTKINGELLIRDIEWGRP